MHRDNHSHSQSVKYKDFPALSHAFWGDQIAWKRKHVLTLTDDCLAF